MDPQLADLPLRDIHTAPPPSWWPPAPGWWLLALLALVGLVWLGMMAWNRYRRYRFKRAMQQELSGLTARYDANRDKQGFTVEAATLLRRLIVHVAGRAEAAALVGSSWSAYLAEISGGDPELVQASVALADAPYRSDGEVDVIATCQLLELWIDRSAREASNV